MADITKLGDETRATMIEQARSERRLPLIPTSGKGRELCDLLRKELLVPDGVISFSVHFALDDVVKVNCEYAPCLPVE